MVSLIGLPARIEDELRRPRKVSDGSPAQGEVAVAMGGAAHNDTDLNLGAVFDD
jgi:hypothetical protein